MVNRNAAIYGSVFGVIGAILLGVLIWYLVEQAKKKPKPTPNVGGSFSCEPVVANELNGILQGTDQTVYRRCIQNPRPVPNGYQTAAECQQNCSGVLPKSIASGNYFITVLVPGGSGALGYVEPVMGDPNVVDGIFYFLTVNLSSNGIWTYVAPTTSAATDGKLSWTPSVSTSKTQPAINLGFYQSTVAGVPKIFPVSVSSTSDPGYLGWVLSTENSGIVFQTTAPNGFNCLNLTSITGFGLQMGPCAQDRSNSSGFGFQTGGLFSCSQIA